MPCILKEKDDGTSLAKWYGLNVDYFGVFFEVFFSEMSKSLGTKFEALLSNQ